ncbi:MAG: peptidylprolyl isomerase A [Desulfuromonas sp.]|uniref:peptidylprolyl isomerase n=1 Tax=Desulfuromonas sp. TaxID=892 RepID=UPI000CB2C5FC|nr:peptidylprolyl isomerase [Desulfuromonas sp.]PLX83318.1 MAG: peptidylprolyl isomerase A [Desulfuromonas sp.]
MARLLLLLTLSLLLAGTAAAKETVVMETSLGAITLELFTDKAPVSVKNFLGYAEDGFYDGTVFHRVIKGFMIQGGGFGADLKKKPTRDPIKNEAGNGLKNERGTIAMARTNVVDSATCQFFINLVDNGPLDHRGTSSSRAYGYAVFGKVIDGMEVVDQIAGLQTQRKGPAFQNLPVEPVTVKSVRRLKQ